MIGPVRQEVLSGIREPLQFDRLKTRLRSFDDEPLSSGDFESAADVYNRCRALGVTASPIDSLICAVSLSRGWPVFTLDQDFARYARVLSLELHAAMRDGSA